MTSSVSDLAQRRRLFQSVPHPTPLPPLPFAGIATFLRAPYASLAEPWSADVGIMGVPFDTAAGFRPGQRFAPQAVREASLRYTLPPEGLYDLRTDRLRLAGLTVRDAGDVDLPSLEPELGRDRITDRARALRQRVALPLFIGGDHSVTFPLLRAFDDVENLHIVQLDAHLDFGDVRNATRFSNSSPFRRAVEAIPSISSITVIGLRGPRFDAEAVQAARARGNHMVPMWALTGDGFAVTPAALDAAVAHVPHGAPVYLSIDVDVLDPAVLPGTSSPEPDGLTYAAVQHLIAAVAARSHVVGADIVELAPAIDPSGNSALLVARMIVDLLASIYQ
jgi:agmatinase